MHFYYTYLEEMVGNKKKKEKIFLKLKQNFVESR